MAITQYMSQLLERQHFTAKLSPFWRFWHLCNDNSAYAAIASCAPSPSQGAIKLRRISNIGTGSLVNWQQSSSRPRKASSAFPDYFTLEDCYCFLHQQYEHYTLDTCADSGRLAEPRHCIFWSQHNNIYFLSTFSWLPSGFFIRNNGLASILKIEVTHCWERWAGGWVSLFVLAV